MSNPRLLSFVFFIALAPVALAQVSPISIRIEQVSKTDTDKFKHTQKRSLKVFLTNASQQDRSGLTVRYFFFGKSVGDNDVILMEKGERQASVASHKTEVVETPTVSKTAIDAHSEKGARGQPGNKVEASGEKLVGYGAQLLEGDKLLTEYFSAPSYKALLAPKK
jgi:hypothetical protein